MRLNTQYLYVFTYILVVFITISYGLTLTNLSSEDYVDMYAKLNNGVWECNTQFILLAEDPTGITSMMPDVSMPVVITSEEMGTSSTKMLMKFGMNLPTTSTTFPLVVKTGDGNTQTTNIDYICEMPPAVLDFEWLHDDSFQYYPAFTQLTPYALLKVKNNNKKIGPPVDITTGLTYSGAVYYLGNDTYYLGVTMQGANAQDYFVDTPITISTYQTPVPYTLKSPFLKYMNTEISKNVNIYPTGTGSIIYYPEAPVIAEYVVAQEVAITTIFWVSYLDNLVFAQGNLTHPTMFKKKYLPWVGGSTANVFNIIDPSTTSTVTFQYQNQFAAPQISGQTNTLTPSNIAIKYTTNSKFQTDVITCMSGQAMAPYPFGFTQGTSTSYLRAFDLNIDYQFASSVIFSDGVYSFNSPTGSLSVDTQPPKPQTIVSYTQIPNTPKTVVRMRITDDLSGFKRTDFGDSSKIISGDLYDGVYEFVVTQSMSLLQVSRGKMNILDQVNNLKSIDVCTDNYVNVDLQRYPFKLLNFSDVTNIRFEKNDINVTNQSVDNNMFIYTNTIDRDLYPGFFVLPFGNVLSFDGLLTYSGSWNDACGCYKIPFTIPKNYPTGLFEYLMVSSQYSQIWETTYFASLLGQDSVLRVYSEQGDLLGPVVTSIDIQNPSVQVPEGQETTITWRLTIEDKYNGFQSGVVSFVSSLDLVRYNFTFGPEQAISGDNKKGVYEFSIKVNGMCKSQPFYIQYAFLQDSAGKFSEYKEGGSTDLTVATSAQFLNPFYTFLDVTTSSAINIDCQNSLTDNVFPVLSSFTFTPEFIDPMYAGPFLNNSRQVVFDFETFDDNGLLLQSLPRVYLIDQNLNIIYQNSKLLSNTSKTATYRCVFDVPYGFGLLSKSGIKVSLYGIVDNQSNFNGYSSTQLADATFKNTIAVEQRLTLNVSIISTNQVFGHGGEITITGKNFEALDQLLINFNNGTISTLPNSIFSSNSIIIFNNSNPVWVSNVTLTIGRNDGSAFSNSLLVQVQNPTPAPQESSSSSTNPQESSSSSHSSSSSPQQSSSDEPPVTNKPQICTNNCGGIDHGECTPSGCVCKSPWVGSDCTSEVIIVKPTINPTSPSTNITVPTTTKDNHTAIYYAIISVVALNELDQNGQLVQKHEFPSWIVSNNTISKYSQYTNSSYLYTSSINNNNITTNVNVSIDYFNQDQPVNITFANQIITMNPYSLKYSVNISEYSFSSSLNTLQLIILSSLETENNDECASKQFGDTVESNSEYIKMQVNDHSLYGRFIKRGVVDGRVKSVSNTLLDSQYNSISTQSEQQTYIGINIPFYSKSVQLDPDFSVLIDQRPASDNEDAVCGKSKSKLSKGQLAGIIVGSVVMGAVVVTAIAYAIYKNKQKLRFEKSISNSLKSME